MIQFDNNIQIEEETISNKSLINIFNPNISNEKKFYGFEGYGCNIKLSLGGIIINCKNHKISCYLFHSHIHEIKLILEPNDNVEVWGVKLFWSNGYKCVDNKFIIDETSDEILATVRYAHCGIGVNFELHQEKNNIKKIIKELSNKHFLDVQIQENKVIQILQEYYDNYKLK